MTDFIHELNDKLEQLEKEEISKFNSLNFPIIFIVAPPRSGTTMIYQLLTLKYDVFYPNNLLAKFYKFPYIFLKAIKDLNLYYYRTNSEFKSHLGNTNGILEPHEWGWFWERLFFKKDKTIYNELCAIQNLYKKPMIFKNVYFNYNIDTLYKIFKKKAVFLIVKRNSFATINSIYFAIKQNKQPIGSKYYRKYYTKFMDNKLKLAVMQYLYDIKKIQQSLIGKNFLKISYENIIKNPDKAIEEFENNFLSISSNGLKKRKIQLDYTKLIKKSKLSKEIKKEINILLEKYQNLSLEELHNYIFKNHD